MCSRGGSGQVEGFYYLGIPIRHILHYAPRRKPAACHFSRRSRRVASNSVDGNVDYGPSALGQLLAEPKETDIPNGNQGRENLELRMHLVTPKEVGIRLDTHERMSSWCKIA